MRKIFDFPLVFALYLSVMLYFVIWRFSWLLLAVFVLSCALAAVRKFWGIFVILVLVGGLSYFVKADESYQSSHQPSTLTEISPIADSISVNGNQLSFRATADGQTYQCFYTLKSETEQAYWKNLATDVRLTIEASLDIPENQRNFNGFDYREYLATQNIYRQVKIITILKTTPRSGFFDLHLLRRWAILWCNQHFPAPMSSYMTGLLFGYLGKDFSEMSDIYTSLGIIHLFALSGMQVSFFIDLLRKILLRLGVRRDFVDKLQLPFSFFYAFLTGLAVSVIRALLQKNIRLSGLANLSLTFFVLLLIMPKFLLTTGGQLTMMYAFLIAMMRTKFQDWQGIKRILIESLVLSVGVLPLLILDFHVFQPMSILLTFAFSVIFDTIMLPLLVVIFGLSFVFINLSALNFLFVWLEYLIKWVDGLFHYPIVLGTPTLLELLVLFLVIGLLIDYWKNKKWRFVLLPLLIAIFFFVKNPVNPSITMVDIGQGDSFLLEDSFNKQTVLIDTGGKVGFGTPEKWQLTQTTSNASKTLIPYLQSRGIGSLDTVILTHSDEDHCGDLVALADKIKIKEIWVTSGSAKVSSFVKRLKEAKAQVHIVKVGDKLPIFDSQLEVLSSGYTGKGDNNDSIVTYGKFYGTSWLFEGDLERPGEVQLLKDFPTLKVDILKAGHHGSKTASDPSFVKAIQPQIALISCGLNNRFKHPHQETLDTLAANQVSYYRTDLQGAVRFTAKNGSWQVETVK